MGSETKKCKAWSKVRKGANAEVGLDRQGTGHAGREGQSGESGFCSE